ncbi:GNAT family N-acetyltransferase [bacterium]|nr:GNAT family N-acetyltransferase [bacterium]
MRAEATSKLVPVIVAESPFASESRELIAEMGALISQLYPEDGDAYDTPPPALAQGGAFLVARVRGIAAGCGGVVPIDPEMGRHARPVELKRMFVRPGFRGMGVARQILQALEDTARRQSATAILAHCGPRQPEALRLYAANGFVQCGAFAAYAEHPLSIFLEKRLT